MSHVAQVRNYYERNTRLFRALGQDAATHTVHRAIWAPGVRTKTEALTYINEQIHQEVSKTSSHSAGAEIRAIDLGCGVGATLCSLAQRSTAAFYGIGLSISPTQIQLARRYAERLGLAAQCLFLEGNFLHIPFVELFDVAIAVEAMVHATDPAAFLAQVASALRPGGRLIVCDDFLTREPWVKVPLMQGNAGAMPSDLVEQTFRRGWHAAGITSIAALATHARSHQLILVEQRDLTPDLRLIDLPQALVHMLLRAGRYLPLDWAFTQSLIGGLALQYGLQHRIFCHQWLVFEKQQEVHGISS